MKLPGLQKWTAPSRIAALVALVASVPLVGVIAYSTIGSRDAALRSAREQAAQRARATAQSIEALIAERLSDLHSVALAPPAIALATGEVRSDEPDRVQQLLARTREAKGFAALFIVAADGRVVAGTVNGSLGRHGLAAQYLVSALAGEPVLDSARFLSEDGKFYLHAAYPVRDGDGVTGVVVGRFTPDAIDRVVAADTNFAGRREHGVLFDADGIRLSVPADSASRFRPLEPPPDTVRAELIAEQRFGPATSELLESDGALAPIAQLGRWLIYDGTRAPYTRSVGTEAFQVSAAPLPQQRWIYAILVPESEILAAWWAEVLRGSSVLVLLVGLTVAGSAAAARWLATAELRERATRLEETVSARTAALRTSEEQMRAVLHALPDVLLRLGPDGRVLESLSHAAADLFGGSRDVIGQSVTMLLPADMREQATAAIRASLERQALEIFEFDSPEGANPSGVGPRTLEARLYPDAPATVLCILRDITSRKRQERDAQFLDRATATLARSLDLHETVDALARLAVPAIADLCIIDVAEEGRVRTAAVAGVSRSLEAAALEMRARYPVDASGRQPAALALRTGRAQLAATVDQDYIERVARDAKHLELLNRLNAHSSMAVPLVIHGRTLGVMAFAMAERPRGFTEGDLARAEALGARAAVAIENARLYRELLLASRMKDEFLGIVSHELRTPLNAVLGWARLLRTDALDATRREHALDAIERNARAQRRLIEDLLDASRIISGKLQVDVQPVEICAVIEAALDSVRPGAEARGIAIDTDIAPARLCVVSADPARLQQVFWNLLSNAVKFTPDGRRVLVSARGGSQEVAVTIADSGVGIDPAFLPFVFERFRQADSTSTRAHGGLGLGLAIARHLVEMHGGTIQAASGGRDQGARFTVKLPVHAGHPAADAPAPADLVRPRQLLGHRVLVVDDSDDTRELLTLVLEAEGATVRCAATAAEAIDVLLASHASVIVSDIGMPDEDGYAFLSRLRALEQQRGLMPVPVIALTAYARPDDRRRARAAGFAEHISKPCDAAELVRAILVTSGDLSAGAGSH